MVKLEYKNVLKWSSKDKNYLGFFSFVFVLVMLKIVMKKISHLY